MTLIYLVYFPLYPLSMFSNKSILLQFNTIYIFFGCSAGLTVITLWFVSSVALHLFRRLQFTMMYIAYAALRKHFKWILNNLGSNYVFFTIWKMMTHDKAGSNLLPAFVSLSHPDVYMRMPSPDMSGRESLGLFFPGKKCYRSIDKSVAKQTAEIELEKGQKMWWGYQRELARPHLQHDPISSRKNTWQTASFRQERLASERLGVSSVLQSSWGLGKSSVSLIVFLRPSSQE